MVSEAMGKALMNQEQRLRETEVLEINACSLETTEEVRVRHAWRKFDKHDKYGTLRYRVTTRICSCRIDTRC